MPSLYLLIDLAVISVPLAFSWHTRLRFVDRWRDFLPACLTVLAGFIAWDVFFTSEGIWGFSDAYLLGVPIAGLPLEEWLFFICVPYACVFTYHAFAVLGIGDMRRQTARALSAGMILVCFTLSVLFPDRWYTVTTAVLVAVFVAGMLHADPRWLGRFWFSFFVILIPFTVTNGLLTGIRFWEYPILNLTPEAVSDQIVWYNNAHNLGVRFFSIPFDDFLYAFLLTGLNVSLFEYFQSRRSRIQSESVS